MVSHDDIRQIVLVHLDPVGKKDATRLIVEEAGFLLHEVGLLELPDQLGEPSIALADLVVDASRIDTGHLVEVRLEQIPPQVHLVAEMKERRRGHQPVVEE